MPRGGQEGQAQVEIALHGPVRLDAQPATIEQAGDVRQLKSALNRLGFYMPDPRVGMDADMDDGLRDALYAFQRKATIYFDDVGISPGSTTERILNRDLAALPSDRFYIWRTVGDEKVRGEHAARNGRRFPWGDPPDGEHPGDDYNCRCWAEPFPAPYHPWIEWAQKRREERAAERNVAENPAGPKGLNEEPIDAPAEEDTDPLAPILTLFAALLLFRAGKLGLPILRVFLSRSSRNAYKIALKGGKHAGTLKRYKNVSDKELEKGIKSFDKQINRHLEKIKNPEKEYPDFKNLYHKHQKDLLEKKWPSDIKRLEEEKEILRRILDERH